MSDKDEEVCFRSTEQDNHSLRHDEEDKVPLINTSEVIKATENFKRSLSISINSNRDNEKNIKYTVTPKNSRRNKEILWMKVKGDTTIWNVASLFFIPCIGILAGSFVNTNMPHLLQHPDYFNVPFEDLGKK